METVDLLSRYSNSIFLDNVNFFKYLNYFLRKSTTGINLDVAATIMDILDKTGLGSNFPADDEGDYENLKLSGLFEQVDKNYALDGSLLSKVPKTEYF